MKHFERGSVTEADNSRVAFMMEDNAAQKQSILCLPASTAQTHTHTGSDTHSPTQMHTDTQTDIQLYQCVQWLKQPDMEVFGCAVAFWIGQ